MPTPGVVEPLNIVKNVRPDFVPGLVPGAEHPFDLQRREETLRRCVVPALAPPAHAAGDALIGQQTLEVLAGVFPGQSDASAV